MMAYACVNIVGLLFDVAGVWLVFFFALSPPGAYVSDYPDERSEQRAKRFSYAGLICLTLGFSLQALASGLSILG